MNDQQLEEDRRQPSAGHATGGLAARAAASGDEQQGRPISANCAWTRNTAYGESRSASDSTVELESTMTGRCTGSRPLRRPGGSSW